MTKKVSLNGSETMAGGTIIVPIDMSTAAITRSMIGNGRKIRNPSEAGLNVTITVERPETLELMRRNIHLLARECREIGYEGAQLDFAQGGQGGSQPEPAPDALGPSDTSGPVTVPTGIPSPGREVLLTLSDRLDIRL